MMNETPEAALRSRIADLEQQLKLADEGTSRLAQRCLELEKQLQTFYAAHPQKERQTDSPALVQPLLYYDAGFGFSQKDTRQGPGLRYDELNGMVTATSSCRRPRSISVSTPANCPAASLISSSRMTASSAAR